MGTEVLFSEAAEDRLWDEFLASNPTGEFAQSSLWAQAKRCDGWQVARILLPHEGGILGGCQMLWRDSRLCRIGYVSRGPVLHTDAGRQDAAKIVKGLRSAAQRLRIGALIAQCPEGGEATDRLLEESGFLPNRIKRVITATWMTPLSDGIEAVHAGMSRRARGALRKASRIGVRVVEGSKAELGIFFRLMEMTCARQKVTPNPPSLAAAEAVWEAFAKHGKIRLGLAEFEGKTVAATLSILFGRRLSIWKKGSDPNFLHLHPVELLYDDAMRWGIRGGATHCDYGSLERKTAQTLLEGGMLTPGMARSRDYSNIKFGGHPVLLPEARVYFRNRLLRGFYSSTAGTAVGSKLLRRRYHS